MTDTLRTASYLQNALRDGQAMFAIPPQVIRDFVVSVLSITASIAAAGTNQGTATALASFINIVTSVSSGTGVILNAGTTTIVLHRGASALAVYPPSGGQIESLSTNAAMTLQPGQDALFVFDPANGLHAYATTLFSTTSLTTTLPGVSGGLWSDAGVVSISQ